MHSFRDIKDNGRIVLKIVINVASTRLGLSNQKYTVKLRPLVRDFGTLSQKLTRSRFDQTVDLIGQDQVPGEY